MTGKETKDNLKEFIHNPGLLHPGYKLTICYACESYVKLYRREDGAFEGTCCGDQIVVLPGKGMRRE